jgi:hypothetical protein
MRGDAAACPPSPWEAAVRIQAVIRGRMGRDPPLPLDDCTNAAVAAAAYGVMLLDRHDEFQSIRVMAQLLALGPDYTHLP